VRRIALVTTSRSDWGIQRAIAEQLQQMPDVTLNIIAGGMHVSREFGYTVNEIRADGFEPTAALDYLVPGDSPSDVATSIGRGVAAFAEQFATSRPDLLSVLGDRFDMLPAVLAATPFNIPIAHIHGGELTEGAFDDNIRHAITKMSHIHLVSTNEYAQRVIQMGEQPEHVHCVGAPGLDDIAKLGPTEAQELKRTYGFVEGQTNALVVYHPETHGSVEPKAAMDELLRAVEKIAARPLNIVIVSPNADTGHRGIAEAIRAFCDQHANARAFTSIPRTAFLSLMRFASVMIGSSSAGIIEAPSFKTPVVNVGDRQAGRVQAGNVINAAPMSRAIDRAIRRALSVEFARSLRGLENPYGDGQTAVRIAELLATTQLSPQLLAKRFVDQPQPASAPQSWASSTNTRTADSISSRHAHSLGEW
jgi:GDP/UDP-N,N'-diacetylbacillosamine 2-epimerase (hydrolysing)